MFTKRVFKKKLRVESTKNGGSQKAADNPVLYRVFEVLPAPNTENKNWIRNTSSYSFETIKKKHNTAAFSIFLSMNNHHCYEKFKNATFNRDLLSRYLLIILKVGRKQAMSQD